MPADAIGPTLVPSNKHVSTERAAKAAGDDAWAAREFESVFLSQAVDQMLKTVKLGAMGGGHAEETWRSFLSRAIADEIAGTGSTAISESVSSAIAGYSTAQTLAEE